MNRYRAIVIGANGFIGRILLAELQSREIEAIGVILSSSETIEVSRKVLESLDYPPPELRLIKSLGSDELNTLFAEYKPNVVFHLAGMTKCKRGHDCLNEYIQSNLVTIGSVITAIGHIQEEARPMLVVPGSQMEYGLAEMPWTESRKCKPSNSYGVSKYLTTELVLSTMRSHAIKGTIVRLPIIFGPGQWPSMFIPELVSKCILGLTTSMTSGRQTRRFLHCKDAVRFFHEVASSLVSGETVPSLVNAPASAPMTILSVAKKITSFEGKQNLLKIGALPERHDEIIDAWPDSTLANQLNYIDITPMDQALKSTYKWYSENAWFTEEKAKG